MTQSLAKYLSRSPRYILNAEDDSLIRLAGPRQEPWEEGTDIKNVSLTGLCFTAPSDLCPTLGEVIKVQFRIPSDEQMACHALVTRLERINAASTTVAVHFYRMELSQRILLAQGLLRRLELKNGGGALSWPKTFSLMTILFLLFFWSALNYFAFQVPFSDWLK